MTFKLNDKVWVKKINVQGTIKNIVPNGEHCVFFEWPAKVDKFERWQWWFLAKDLCLMGRSV